MILGTTLPIKLERAFFVSVIIILLGLLLLFGIKSCEKSKEATKFQNELATKIYNDSMPAVQQRLKDSSLIVTQSQLLATKDAEIVKHIEKEDKLFKLASNVQIKTVYQIKEVLVPFQQDSFKIVEMRDTIKGIPDSTEYLKIPARVVEIDPDFQLDATVMDKGLKVNYLLIPNTTTIDIGEIGSVFHHESAVKIHHSNKNILELSTKNVIVTDPKAKSNRIKEYAIVGTVVLSLATIGETLLYVYTHK